MIHLKQLQWVQVASSFRTEVEPFIRILSAAWSVAGYILYPGANTFCELNRIDIIAEQQAATGSSEVRVYDVTNGNVIGTITGINAAGMAIYSTTSLSNIPSAAAVFEIQARKVSGTQGRLAHVALIKDGCP